MPLAFKAERYDDYWPRHQHQSLEKRAAGFLSTSAKAPSGHLNAVQMSVSGGKAVLRSALLGEAGWHWADFAEAQTLRVLLAFFEAVAVAANGDSKRDEYRSIDSFAWISRLTQNTIFHHAEH
jgi:hypothetical protein